jgi:hypothetical protein
LLPPAFRRPDRRRPPVTVVVLVVALLAPGLVVPAHAGQQDHPEHQQAEQR